MKKIQPADVFRCNNGEPACSGDKPAGRKIPLGKGISTWLLWVAGDPATIEEVHAETYCNFHRPDGAQPLVDWARVHDLLDEEAFAAKFVPPPAVEVSVQKKPDADAPARRARRGKKDRENGVRTAVPARPVVQTAAPSRSTPSRTGSSGNLKPVSTKPSAAKPVVSVRVPLPTVTPTQAASRKPVLPPASIPIARPPRPSRGRDPRLTFKIGDGVDLQQILDAQAQVNAGKAAQKEKRRLEHEARKTQNAARRAEESARLEAERQAVEAQQQLEADLKRKREEGYERHLAEKAYRAYLAERGAVEPIRRQKGTRVVHETVEVNGRRVAVVRFEPRVKGFAQGLSPIPGEDIPVGVAAPAVPEGAPVREKVDISAYTYRKVVDTDGVVRLVRIGQEFIGNAWTTVARMRVPTDPETGLEGGWFRRWLSQDDLPVAYSTDELFNALVSAEVNRLEADPGAKDLIVARDRNANGKVVYQLSLLRLWETIFTEVVEATKPVSVDLPSAPLVVDINAEA